MASITFTAGSDCDIQVSATFDASKSGGGDFGATGTYRLFVTRTPAGGGAPSTAFGTTKGVALTRARYSDLLTAPIVLGDLVTAGLQLNGGTVFITASDIDVRVEVIKR